MFWTRNSSAASTKHETPLHHFFAEGEDGAEGEFEVLYAPGDTYDGAAEDESKDEVCKSYLPPAKKYPEDVEYYL